MKQSPELDRAQARMGRGVLSRDGFLGTDPRGLGEIMAADHGAVQRLGLDHRELASALERVTDAALARFGAPAVLDKITATTVEAMGRLPCPFGHPGLYPKAEILAYRGDTGATLVWTALQVHLIGEHGFYEGRGSPYRLEPEELVVFFGLKPAREIPFSPGAPGSVASG